IFIPGGYTAASAAPATPRSAIAHTTPGAPATPRVASAATTAPPANNRRADHRSASVNVADTSAPATKPSCTEMVSHAPPAGPRPQTAARAGVTAEALNHGAIAHASAAASTTSTRCGLTYPSDARRTSREDRTSPRDGRRGPGHRT